MSEPIKKIHKDFITKKVEIRNILINIERDSVSLGDDITAPHHTQKYFGKDDFLSSLFEKILYDRYIPEIADSTWDICYNNKVLGQICFDINSKGTFKLFAADESIAFLNNANIYCKHAEYQNGLKSNKIKKEDFEYENKKYYIENAYVYDNKEYILVIKENIFDDGTIEYANRIVEKYLKEIDQILTYILDNKLRKFYSSTKNYSDEYIKDNIGRPQINIFSKKDDKHPNWKFNYEGSIDYCESLLDEHIISIDFIDNLNINGIHLSG